MGEGHVVTLEHLMSSVGVVVSYGHTVDVYVVGKIPAERRDHGALCVVMFCEGTINDAGCVGEVLMFAGCEFPPAGNVPQG